MSLRRVLRKALKVAAVGAVAYGAIVTGGAGLSVIAQRAMAARQGGGGAPSQGGGSVYYSAPYYPGYSYTGSTDGYGGGAFQAIGGTGGAAIPIEQSSGESRAPSGFQITPVVAIAGIGVLLLGFLAFRR